MKRNNKIKNSKVYYGTSFAICLLIATAGCMFFLFKYHGCFTMGGDINDQVIPFMILANSSIKNGNINFNWSIDLGSAFLPTMYQYLGSPFFGFTLLFPSSLVPYLIGPLFILRFAFCGPLAYGYLQRFVKPETAIMGSIMYSFCGFMLCFSEYYTMLECVCFFPIVLIAMEELIKKRQRGLFALAVCINSLANITVFFGEAIFLVLYFFIRTQHEERLLSKLFQCVIEGVLGIGMAAWYVMPIMYNIVLNPRVSEKMSFGEMLCYVNPLKYLALFKDIFFPNEYMSHAGTFFSFDFSTCSTYIPFVGMSFVLIMLINRRKKEFASYSWLWKILLICVIILLIPGLNGAFMGFSSTEIYHRWLYMPTLLLVLMSCIVIDNSVKIDSVWEGWVTFGIMLLFAVLCVFLHYTGALEIIIDTYEFWMCVLIGVISALWCAILWMFHKNPKFHTALMCGVIIFSCLCLAYTLSIPYRLDSPGRALKTKLDAMSKIDSQDERYRFLSAKNEEICPAQLKGIGCFASIVEPSIFELYHAIGLDRKVATPTHAMYDEYYDLFSAKYYITCNEQENTIQTIMDDEGGLYCINELEYAVPIGWGYDTYITRSEFDAFNYDTEYDLAALVMINSLVIPDEAESEVSQLLEHADVSQFYLSLSMENRMHDLAQHKEESSESFETSTMGFYSSINAKSDKYAFFSVPNSRGWKAKVNGHDVSIVDICGLMAVPIFEGSNEIVFEYHTPFLRLGICIALLSVTIWITFYLKRRYTKRSLLIEHRDL